MIVRTELPTATVGPLLAAPAGQAAVAVAEEGVGAGETGDDLTEGPGEPGVAFPVGAVLARPADCLSIGVNLAQDTERGWRELVTRRRLAGRQRE